MTDTVVDWLVAGDPSIRWQVERDLLDRTPATWEETQSQIGRTGWGRRLLDLQDPGGTWGGGLYSPKWISTTYTLLLLRRFGLAPSNDGAISGCERLLDDAAWVEGGVSYWSGRDLAERCVNGMVLSLVSYFDVDDPRVDSIVELLLSAAMSDGGWNCRDFQGATHSSFHTTISVLEGLTEWRRRTGRSDADTAIARGHEFMLDHRMYRSHRTGAVINEAWTLLHFPPRWHYDVLRGLDHLQDAGAVPDPRAIDAIELVRSRRRPDGRWGKGPQYSGDTFFALEPGRVPGRWNTLRARRVLKWWDEGVAPDRQP
ncbi:MAG: hypothetical protein U9R47_07345 [Actinomycetota bacterium]|nr:hypothetical protein [Actinomycetota bacterium]